MRGRPIDAALRAQVVAALLAGMGVSEASRKYQLPKSTVSRIQADLGGELEQVGSETRDEVGTILVSHLHTNLKALDRIAEQTGRDVWIQAQSAEGLAVLYGKIADHTLRLLEAASQAEGADTSDPAHRPVDPDQGQ